MRDETDREILGSIWGGLAANGWLERHAEAMRGWKAELRVLGKWLIKNDRPRPLLSRRERSLEIFGDEKRLQRHAERRGGYDLATVVRRCGVDDARLGIDPARGLDGGNSPGTWFRTFTVGDISRRSSATFVISENLDPWRAMRDALLYNGASTVFGTRVDGAVFGEGYRILEPEEIDAAAGLIRYESGFRGVIKFLWWGDLDHAGLYQLARAQSSTREVLAPFAAAYARMLEVADLRRLPADTSHEDVPSWIVSALSDELDQGCAERLHEVLGRGLRVPQEVTRIETDTARLMPDVRRAGLESQGYSWGPTRIERGGVYAEDFGDEFAEPCPYEPDEDNLDPYDDDFGGYDDDDGYEGDWQ